MTSPALDRTLEAMDLMARAESAVGGLYEACAGLWKEDGDFWRGLAEEEKHHSEHIRTMIAILAGNPGRFQPGRPFTSLALQTFISGIERGTENVKRAAVTELKALHLARDIEQALIEARFTEVVQTDDKRFRDLAGEIVRDTAVHRRMVENKIAERHARG